MTILTVWNNPNTEATMLAQLSDDPADGSPDDQISAMVALEFFAGFECVSKNYAGPIPAGDADHWRWSGSEITSNPPPAPPPPEDKIAHLEKRIAELEARR